MTNSCLSNLADHIKVSGKQSYQTIAEIFQTSKSSVHRRLKKVKNRSDISGASFFESEEGQQWLLRLVVATIFIFGVIAGVGEERIALFFSMIYVSSFVGVSSSSVGKIENNIDNLILQYKDLYDSKIKNKASELEITPGADETYFDNLMLLVLMDLNSGFIFVEKPESKRNHKTWEKNSLPWLSEFKMVRCFVSDKAKALLKLAKESCGVDWIADLFHMMNDVSGVMKFSFSRLKKSADKSMADVKKQIAKGVEVAKNKALHASLQAELQAISMGQGIYRRNHRRLSTSLHPFAILSSDKQSSTAVEEKMQFSLSEIKTIREKFEISDLGKRLDRVERQIPEAAKQVDLWWGWVETSLDSIDITPELKDWLLYYLLPFIYWRSQLRKTRSKKIKRFYRLSIRAAQKKLNAHPLTPLMCNGTKETEWMKWAQQMTDMFLRTTSAVEGRNGWLSQIHFNGRGLSKKRLESQTAVHNYFLQRADGSTACERLTGEKPEDLFEFIMSNIGPLSEPRKRKIKQKINPLILQGVPA